MILTPSCWVYVTPDESPLVFLQTWLHCCAVEKGVSNPSRVSPRWKGSACATVPARTLATELLWDLSSRMSFMKTVADNHCFVFFLCSQEEGELILEGLLNIYWGLCRPIRLQMFDDNERFCLNRYDKHIFIGLHRVKSVLDQLFKHIFQI